MGGQGPVASPWTTIFPRQVLKAVGLEEYMELFVEHRVQGDVIFNLSEENLKEMGVDKVRAHTLRRHPLASRLRPLRVAARVAAAATTACDEVETCRASRPAGQHPPDAHLPAAGR